MTQSILTPALAERLDQVFGSASDPMPLLEERAKALLPDLRVIVWEGDAATFQFTYVSESAVDLLGYSRTQWTTEPTFWADQVVHMEDRDHAVSYCALCTGQNKDHDFVYRAVGADGRVFWLHDIVRVIIGARRVASLLRGIMIDITEQQERAERAERPARQRPADEAVLLARAAAAPSSPTSPDATIPSD